MTLIDLAHKLVETVATNTSAANNILHWQITEDSQHLDFENKEFWTDITFKIRLGYERGEVENS